MPLRGHSQRHCFFIYQSFCGTHWTNGSPTKTEVVSCIRTFIFSNKKLNRIRRIKIGFYLIGMIIAIDTIAFQTIVNHNTRRRKKDSQTFLPHK